MAWTLSAILSTFAILTTELVLREGGGVEARLSRSFFSILLFKANLIGGGSDR